MCFKISFSLFLLKTSAHREEKSLWNGDCLLLKTTVENLSWFFLLHIHSGRISRKSSEHIMKIFLCSEEILPRFPEFLYVVGSVSICVWPFLPSKDRVMFVNIYSLCLSVVSWKSPGSPPTHIIKIQI